MDTEIFVDWFHTVFVPEVRKGLSALGQDQKAILSIDNCAALQQRKNRLPMTVKYLQIFFHLTSPPLSNLWTKGFWNR